VAPVRIGILGLGTVGGGTLSVLRRNAEQLERRLGRALTVTKVAVSNPDKPRDVDLTGIEVTIDAEGLARDPEVDIVVELAGGVDNAAPLVRAALEAGKPVVTANKALLAERGEELFALAAEQGVDLAYEAAVAGGIPIVKALREGLAGNRIESIDGIVNGTANYILSRMRSAGMGFDAALGEAQELGFAELDPTFDVDGIDAAHKLTLMAAIAFGTPVRYDQVHTEGIRSVTGEDIANAGELGYRIKLLAIAKDGPGGVEARVHPALVPADTMLAGVEGEFNAIQVTGDAVGPTLYYGAGAGAEPTASAVVADLMDVARTLEAPADSRVPYLGFRRDGIREPQWAPMEAVETEYYLRMHAYDQPGVLERVTRILAEEGISIEAIRQKEPAPEQADVPVVLLTHTTREAAMRRAVAAIDQLDVITQPSQVLRVEEG
jgi:homoserine dehydrogenase